ncbi:PREDICTED: TNF receptor-associated factor family protein DDB_G0272098-like [Ceratosolen solmsi marchali]|uniref:TNF receptor-associated factor family protein DDB_G0272098-like n=1 Tax=Ceratosolen solmsi marchali TaxID=326594 RepID=A0AAJ7DUV0_9HYME|nr:PREDICTED: TNF receptor-associated factor family protein DDB_G0272098-like [Ceratosolen solmsi marchali]
MKELSNKSVPDEESESKQIDETIKQSVSENNNLMDYEKIEEQLSIITNTNIKNNCSKKVEVIYDQVSKVEQGKLVKKKYARLKTLDTNIAKSSFTMDKKRSPLSDFALELETLQKDEITLQVPPTPQILSPGSSSFMMPISKLSEDSRTIQSLVATPLECPLTPKIVLTPPKSVNNLHKGSEKPISSPYYEPILNNFKISKKSEITQFEVIKENLLKNKKTTIESNIKNIDDVIKLNTSMYREKKVNLKSDSSSASSCNCESCSSSNKEDIAETPVKNDNTCTEVDIFETPSISKIIETPMNFNTKISDIMMFQEQEMQKVQNSKVKISKITTKSPMELIETFPSNIEMNALGIEKNANTLTTTHTIQIKKSEEEVSKAVQSIITNQEEKINKNQNTSVDSIVFDSSYKNESKSIDNKLELVKALESITNTNQKTQDYSFFKSTNANNENDSEANLELVLEDENVSEISSIEVNKTKERFIQNNISPHQHNTRFKSRQMADEKNVSLNNSNGFSNSNIPCQEIQYVFDEDNYKRKRRKVFSNDELTWEFHDELGNLMNATAPTNLDIIFQINPARKRTLKQSKAIKREKFVYVEDVIKKSMMNHSNNNNPISDTNNATYNEKVYNIEW